MPGDQVWVRTGSEWRRADAVCRDNPLTFSVGQGAEFRIAGAELSPREHRVEIAIKPLGFGDIYTRFGFLDQVGGTEPFLATHEGFHRPVALANESAFAVLNRAGDLSADWNWFGLATDNGGLYFPPARFTRYVRFSVQPPGGGLACRLVESAVEARLLPGRLLSVFRPLNGLILKKVTFMPPELAAVVSCFELRNEGVASLEVDLLVDFATALVPYGLLGVELRTVHLKYDPDAGTVTAHTPHLPYTVALGGDRCPLICDRFANGSGRLAYRFRLEPGTRAAFIFAVAGDAEGAGASAILVDALARSRELLEVAATTYRAALDHSIVIRTPDPDLDLAWTFARHALQVLSFRHPEIGPGICAGLPRFPNYWSRDSAWAALDLLAAGETSFVREVLANFFSYQLNGRHLGRAGATTSQRAQVKLRPGL